MEISPVPTADHHAKVTNSRFVTPLLLSNEPYLDYAMHNDRNVLELLSKVDSVFNPILANILSFEAEHISNDG
jgi:hypothetical protein